MTRKTLYSKRIIAVAVALMLLVGTLFTGVVSSSAASLTDGLDVVAAKSQNGCGSTYQNYSTVTDITGGGIKYQTNTQNGSLSPYVHGNAVAQSTKAFPGDGFRLQFNNYTTDAKYSTHENYQKFIVGFA